MDIRKLEYFVTLAQHRNFTSAANALFITQPTLSQQIRILEKELGVKLFDRTNGISLTEAGEILFPEAVSLIAQDQRCMDVINRYINKRNQTINIATMGALEYSVFPLFISDFKNRFPEINVNVYATDFDGAYEFVKEEKCDFSISSIPKALITDDLDYLTISTDRICLIYPKKFPKIDLVADSEESIKKILSMKCYSYNFRTIKDRRFEFIQKYIGDLEINYYENFTEYLLSNSEAAAYTTFPYIYCQNLGLEKWFHLVPLPKEYGELLYVLLFKKDGLSSLQKKFIAHTTEYLSDSKQNHD